MLLLLKRIKIIAVREEKKKLNVVHSHLVPNYNGIKCKMQLEKNKLKPLCAFSILTALMCHSFFMCWGSWRLCLGMLMSHNDI